MPASSSGQLACERAVCLCCRDLSYTVRIALIENSDDWAKIGLMIRQSTAANAKHAIIYLSPHLTRLGDVYRSEIPPDGTTWTLLGSVNIAMGATLYVGLPVTAYNDGVLCTAAFSNVSVERFGVQLPADADYSGTVDAAAGQDAVLAEQYGPAAAAAISGCQSLTASQTPVRRRAARGDAILATSPLAVDLLLAYDHP
jgi:hypothetical protein